MNFIPYNSPAGTVDLTHADAEFRKALEAKMEQMRRITVRWVPVMSEIARRRPEMHWCSYDDGRVICFVTLKQDEAFADLEDIYDLIASHVRRLKELGNYKGDFAAEPDPEDDTVIRWRTWKFVAGDSALVINCSFHASRYCRVVDDGTETVTVEKKRVECGPSAETLAATPPETLVAA